MIRTLAAWLLLSFVSFAFAADVLVATNDELNAALRNAVPGDVIKIAPGRYPGYHAIQGTNDVTITAVDPKKPPVLCDSTTACLQILGCGNVKVSFVDFDGARINGLHLAWDVDNRPEYVKSYDNLSPCHHITLEDLKITNTSVGDPFGNNDGLKTSGVDFLTIRRVTVRGWGNGGGSGWDCLNSQDVLAEDCTFDLSERPANSANDGVTFKAGCRRVKFHRNTLIEAGKVGLEFGQDSGGKVIRDPFGTVLKDGTVLNYEAFDVEAWDNIIVGSIVPVQFVRSRKSFFHHNYVFLLRTNTGMSRKFFFGSAASYPGVPRATDVRIEDNLLVYSYAGLERTGRPFFSDAADTSAAIKTFTFARNTWRQVDRASQGEHYPNAAATGTRLGLPTLEINPVYQ